jgi:DNA-binding CsgD family transcriptional regulator/tetratricopeptide (TPR) repeat protein
MTIGEGTASQIVGRETELGLIDALLDDSTPGGSGALLLAGEPGVGKTTLLDAAVTAASDRGHEVARAIGVEFDTEVSFGALGQLLNGLHDEFQGVSTAYRDALRVVLGLGRGPTPSPMLVGNAILAALEARAARRPVLLIADDLQWLDPASFVAVMFVARRLTNTPVRFLGATRTGTGFDAEAGLPVRHVSALSEDSAVELVGSRFPGLTGWARQRLIVGAEGNPLALLEFAGAVQDGHGLPDHTAGSAPLSQRLRDVYAPRILALPAATRSVLLLAALHGAGEAVVLQPAAATDALSALAPAERDRLISVNEANGRVVFRHPVIRSTVVELASDTERRRAHYALADALIDQPERRAWHLADATVEPDEKVAKLLESTAHEILRKGDAVSAADALGRASELSPHLLDRSRRLIAAASLRAEVTGELRSASELLGSALRGQPALTDSLLAAVATAQLLINAEGDVETAHHLLVTAIDKYADRHDSTDETLIDALHALLMVCWMAGRPDMWTQFDAAMARLTSPVPPVLLMCRSTFGDPARDALPVVDQLDMVTGNLPYEFNPVAITRIGIASVYADRLSQCRDAFERVVRDGREGGAIALAIQARLQICLGDWQTGRWDEALELADEGNALSEEHGYRRYTFILGGYIKAIVSAARGQTAAVKIAARELTDWARDTGGGAAETLAHHVMAVSAIGDEDFEHAYREASAISPAGEFAAFAPQALWVLFDLVEAAVKTDRLADAQAHVAVMRERRIGEISTRLALVVAGCGALTAPPERAAAMFDEALATRGATLWPFDLARVKLAYGEHFRRTHAPVDAALHLRDALHTFQELGARPWERRAAAELRTIGLPAPKVIDSDDDTLSPQDLEIATLAASGMTNKQIAQRVHLSHRTVGAHLYRIFPILGISSRAALHDALKNTNGEH